ncbi:kinetochore protein spc25 [Rhodotorula sp. JG-1b]|nr:kinetochore protein spc25 [Rhodotorula sp. JG-1b]
MATAFAPRMSMPGTPRGNGTTPRSARRLQSTPSSRLSFGGNSLGAVNHAAAALAPLPPINTRTYPERSYADDDELRDLMERDKVAVDDAVSILGHALASTRKRLVESLEEIAAEHKRLERLTRELGDAAKDMVKTVQREKDEMDKAKSLENEVQTRARSLAVQVETANGEVKEIQARLQARRELKAKQRAAFTNQVARNGPELAFLEQKLGLSIRGKAPDVVQFAFHNIDSASFHRTFSIDLDASKAQYTVSAITPPSFLPSTVLSPLLSALNSSRNLYRFILAVRHAFVDEVALEKKSFASELEREKERKRVREGREREEVVRGAA